jgi:hypothetical protein
MMMSNGSRHMQRIIKIKKLQGFKRDPIGIVQGPKNSMDMN